MTLHYDDTSQIPPHLIKLNPGLSGKQASKAKGGTPDVLGVAKVPKPRNHEEADLDRQILELAHLYGYLAHHTRPAWTKQGYRTPLMGDTGLPDWVLARSASPGRDKRLVFIETKSSTGKLSAAQKPWYDALNNAGAEVYMVKPADWDWLVERLK